MTLKNLDKCPWPWFGGKSQAAPVVWEALGDVLHYVEPFAGSLAVLLNRPHLANRPYFSETVNDLDGLLVNAWRGIQLQPDATAEAASNPVSEADLHARHLALVRWRAEHELEHLMGDPLWCDPVMAGWWIWGCSCWIGSGWCSGDHAWVLGDGDRLTKRSDKREPGVSRQRPHLGNNGLGVNHAGAREPGVESAGSSLWDPSVPEECYHPVTMPEVRRWFAYLSARLRHVRILNGDWKRCVTGGASKILAVRQGHGPCGVFLDPPYAASAGRSDDLYACEDLSVAHDVAAWAIEHGEDPQYRIVVAGFDGEHGTRFIDAGWTAQEWFQAGFLRGGMANIGKNGHQQARERLWLSPHCLHKSNKIQKSIWNLSKTKKNKRKKHAKNT
jgi:hypothetical protein